VTPRIVHAHAVQNDILEIWSYIAEDNIGAADRLLETFDEKINMLAESPGIGRRRPELKRGIRSFRVGQYLILYQIVRDGIEIIRVLHGARNLRRIFRQSQ
jgi:toxin ParE1/3/4